MPKSIFSDLFLQIWNIDSIIIINSKNKTMILGFLKGFNVDGKRKSTDFEDKIKQGVKIHTIRWDAKNRWKKGRKIHFATGVRSSRYNCFIEGDCTGTQEIVIRDRMIWIDDCEVDYDEFINLVKNDGFDSKDDFWWWFDQYSPFLGKIIHWTDFRY